MRNVSHRNWKIKSKYKFYLQNFVSENQADYEMTRKNVVKPGRSQMTI
jgi:hypothetical protein